MVENLLLWVFKIRLLYTSVHSDEHPLLRCLRGILYVWDDFRIISLNYLFMLMTRSYDGILIRTNSAINILIDLIWILSYFCCCTGMLEYTYFIYLTTNSSRISVECVCHYYTYHCWMTSTSFHLYSWGLDILLYLYMHLRQVSLEKTKQVGWCLVFLQVKRCTRFFVFVFFEQYLSWLLIIVSPHITMVMGASPLGVSPN